MGLTLTREVGQAVEITLPMCVPATVRVDAISAKQVRLCIEAPQDVAIHRAELAEQARAHGMHLGARVPPDRFDLVEYLKGQTAWSLETFGPGPMTASLLDHIRSECVEVEEKPHDTVEWIDIAMLALDGAVRSGATAQEVAALLSAKFEVVRSRQYPAIGSTAPDRAVCHIKVPA